MSVASPGVSVDGGRSGTHARTEDLARASRALAEAAALVDGVGAWARSETAARVGWLYGGPTFGHQGADAAVAAVDTGPDGASAIARELRDAARSLAELTRLLEDAEQGSTTLLDRVEALRRVECAVALPFAAAPCLGPEVVGAGAVDAALRAAGWPAPGQGNPVVAWLASELALSGRGIEWLFGARGTLDVSEVATEAGLPPADVAGLLDRIDSLYPAPGEAGSEIAIERIHHADGSTAVIVEIPGTQNWWPTGTENVFDIVANLELVAGQAALPMIGVWEALEQLGVGPDEPLLLAGHSQGGLVAMSLAALPAFATRFDLRGVVTAGSPVGSMRPAPGVAVLSLEHTTDVVPALDGARNPDARDWVTVRRDLTESDDLRDRAAAWSLVESHEAATYERTADTIDDSGLPSLRDWRDDTDQFFAGDGAWSERTVLTVRRSESSG